MKYFEELSNKELKYIDGGNALVYWETFGDALAAMNRATVGSSAWNQALSLRNSLWVAMDDLGYIP